MPLSETQLQAAVREVLAAPADGAARDVRLSATQVATMIDHTLLKPEANSDQIRMLCDQAVNTGFGAICVNPCWVPLCAGLLKGSSVKIATVIGFPLGATLTEVKVYEAERSMAAGASELDMVIAIGALKSRRYDVVQDDIAAVVNAVHAGQPGPIVKVIIETAFLTDQEKVEACLLAQAAGAEFVKTSTGFGPSGATVADVALMRRAIGPHMGLKAAGGIRSAADTLAMIAAGATRIGTSSGVKIISDLVEQGY